MAVERLTDYTRRIWTGLATDAPDPDMQVGDVIYYMDTSTCSIITGIPAPGSIDTEDLPDLGGGGGGDDEGTITGDCFGVQYAYVTSGPNNIINTSQIWAYLRDLAGLPGGSSNAYWTVVDDPGGWVYDEVVGVDAGTSNVFRYRNGAFSSVNVTPSYTAKLPEGKRYLAMSVYNKGAPSV